MTAAQPASAPRWLFGPTTDLLFGCGALYIVAFAFFAVAGDAFLSVSPVWLAPLCVLLLSLPHYGATLLRVYEHRTDRRAYALFSVWVTGLLVLAFIAGAYHAGVGSFLLTVYLTWSPWHYTGQNYGLAVMFLRRRGVPVLGSTKRWLYGSFIFSYALTFCVIHESSTWAGARSLPQSGPSIHFVSLGLPGAELLAWLAAAGWLLATGVALGSLMRRASLADLLPIGVLVTTQALWFGIPAVALHWGIFAGARPLDPNQLGAYLIWIAVGHAVQYLWVTSYYAKAAEDWKGRLPYFAKTLAAGALVWTLPVIVFAADALGAPSYETGLAFLVASVVNLHHFVLDGAIWKLRNTRIAKVLVMSGASAEGGDVAPNRGLRAAVWGLASACLVVAIIVLVHETWLLPRALVSADPGAIVRTLDRLRPLGRDTAAARTRAGELLAERQRYAPALEQYQRSVALAPTADRYGRIAITHAQLGDMQASVRAQDQALSLEPSNPKLFEFAALLSERVGLAERAAELRAKAAGLLEQQSGEASRERDAEVRGQRPALY